MNNTAASFSRRARPLLGTLVEIGLMASSTESDDAADFDIAFAAVLEVQKCLSRFEADSDVSRFHALKRGERLAMRRATREVLAAARELHAVSDGVFDITLGTAAQGWYCDGEMLHKLSDTVRLDLGGIAKGHAVDLAVQALIGRGCVAGWVNAGGDLRAFGSIDVPVQIRDESSGGVRPFATIQDGAFATSHFGIGARSQLAGSTEAAHVSVCAPMCLHADALTKIVAIGGNLCASVLDRYHATAWMH